MLFCDKNIEVYSASYLGDRIYGEGLIEGFGFVLYGHTLSLIPIFTDKDPEKEKENLLKEIEKLVYGLTDKKAA